MSLVGIATAAIAVLVAVRFAVLAVRSAGVAQVRAEGTRRRLRPKLPALRRRYRTDPVPPQHKTAGLYRAGHGAWFAALLGGSFVRGSLPAGMGASSSAWRSSPRSPRSAGYHGELPVVFSASIRPPRLCVDTGPGVRPLPLLTTVFAAIVPLAAAGGLHRRAVTVSAPTVTPRRAARPR